MDIILDVIQVNESTLLLIHGDLPLSGSQKIKKKKKNEQNLACFAFKASLTCNREVIERVGKIGILWLLLVSNKGPIGF